MVYTINVTKADILQAAKEVQEQKIFACCCAISVAARKLFPGERVLTTQSTIKIGHLSSDGLPQIARKMIRDFDECFEQRGGEYYVPNLECINKLPEITFEINV